MNCNEARRWLDAHLDREIDPARDAEVSAHFQTCATCAEIVRQRTSLKAAVGARLPRYTPPAALATRIRADLRAARDEELSTPFSAPSRTSWRRWLGFPGWGGVLTAAACALVLGFALGQRHASSRDLDGLLSRHIEALTSGRLIEVASSDRHTVKPWLAQHVDFSPPVFDLAVEGFPLAGARVERVEGRLTAALVYHRAKHIVTVFIWPRDVGHSPKSQSARGYHATTWQQGEFNYVAISDIAPSDLEQLASLLRATP